MSAPAAFARGEAAGRLGTRRVLLVVAATLAVIVVVGVLLALILSPSPPKPPCPRHGRCGTPPIAPPLVIDSVWRSSALGYQLEYSSEQWQVSGESPTGVELGFKPADALVIIQGVPASEGSPAELVGARIDALSRRVLGLVRDTDPAHTVLDPQVGYRHGAADSLSGTIDTPQGVGAPVGIVVLGAGDRGLNLVATVVTATSDEERRTAILSSIDRLLNTLRLPGEVLR